MPLVTLPIPQFPAVHNVTRRGAIPVLLSEFVTKIGEEYSLVGNCIHTPCMWHYTRVKWLGFGFRVKVQGVMFVVYLSIIAQCTAAMTRIKPIVTIRTSQSD